MDAVSTESGSMVLLVRLAKLLYRRSSEDRLGMRPRHAIALAYLRDHGGAPQQQLCDSLCIDANNIVLLLNELERAGHVRRLRDPTDRRRHLVELTPAGLRALARAECAQQAIEDEVLAGLGAEDRVALRELLTRALAAAGEPEPDEPAPTVS